MNVTAKLFWVLAVFFFTVAGIYTFWAIIDPFTQRIEWIGTLALTLCGILSALIAFYVMRAYRAQGGELAEDRDDANIDDGDAEQGHFSPWSWWPVTLAAGAALVFLGVAAGVWIAYIGAVVVVVSLMGWVFEYYRGYFQH